VHSFWRRRADIHSEAESIVLYLFSTSRTIYSGDVGSLITTMRFSMWDANISDDFWRWITSSTAFLPRFFECPKQDRQIQNYCQPEHCLCGRGLIWDFTWASHSDWRVSIGTPQTARAASTVFHFSRQCQVQWSNQTPGFPTWHAGSADQGCTTIDGARIQLVTI